MAEPGASEAQPRVSSLRLRLPETLKARADFLRTAQGRVQAMPGFILQGRDRSDGGPMRVGFTCSKKVGNAVARNLAKRRLREIARLTLPDAGRPGWDYVLVGKAKATAQRKFAAMQSDLRAALKRIHESN